MTELIIYIIIPYVIITVILFWLLPKIYDKIIENPRWDLMTIMALLPAWPLMIPSILLFVLPIRLSEKIVKMIDVKQRRDYIERRLKAC